MTRAPRVALPVVLLVGSVTLVAGFAMKNLCATHAWADGYQYRTSCYNDIFSLYFFRGLARGAFPYVDGDGTITDDEYGDLEYPVGTGLFVGVVAKAVRTVPEPDEPENANDSADASQFFRLTSVGLAAAALLAFAVLWAMAADKWRVLYVAAGPSVLLYAFHNWDFLAVALMAFALLSFHRRRDGPAGLLLGLGAATKLFPGVLLPALVLARLREGAGSHARRGSAWLVGGSVAGFLLPNLPVLFVNPSGWLLPWRFQSTRHPNFETHWAGVCQAFGGCDGAGVRPGFWQSTYPELTGVLSGLLFLVAAAFLLRAEWRRPAFRPFATCFGLLLLFLLTGKVFSPQFALWVLPFFALVRLPWQAFAAFVVTEAAVWISISAWFLAVDDHPGIPFIGGTSVGDPDVRLLVMFATVVVRYAALGWILWLTRRAEDAVGPAAAPEGARASVEFAT